MANWLPLESNPEVLSKYIHKLGVSEDWNVVDVLGLDDDLLEFIPKPIKSVIFLFPCSENYEKHRAEEHDKLSSDPDKHPEDLFYMRQLTHNACGTVALIHSIANNKDILGDGVLKNFLMRAETLDAEERGKALENDEDFSPFHHALALEGQTQADPNEKVNHHFIAIVNHNGELYELDGRKSFPIKHGSTTDETFIQDAAKVCKEFMARDVDEVRFSVMALAAAEN